MVQWSITQTLPIVNLKIGGRKNKEYKKFGADRPCLIGATKINCVNMKRLTVFFPSAKKSNLEL